MAALCDRRFLDRGATAHFSGGTTETFQMCFFPRQSHNNIEYSYVAAQQNARENQCSFHDDLLTLGKRRLLINFIFSLFLANRHVYAVHTHTHKCPTYQLEMHNAAEQQITIVCDTTTASCCAR